MARLGTPRKLRTRSPTERLSSIRAGTGCRLSDGAYMSQALLGWKHANLSQALPISQSAGLPRPLG